MTIGSTITDPHYNHRLSEAKKHLEFLIMATPSGEARDLLTEANIKFFQAEERLIEAHARAVANTKS
jgi:hypothetical protein